MIANFGVEEAVAIGDRHAGAALPVCRSAQQVSAPVPHLVDVVGRHMQVGEVEHDVVAHIFGVLHGAEDGIGAAVHHHVEGAEVVVALESPCHRDDQRRRDQLHQQHGGDEAEGDAGFSECGARWS